MGGPRLVDAHRRGGAAVAAVLLAAGLGACTDGEPEPEVTAPTFASATPSSEPEPPASGPPSASTEPSEAPTQAAPPLPDAATQQTPEGAVAFTEWWFETLNYATATGDTEGLRAAYEATCTSCDGLAQRIDDAYGAGGRIQGGALTVTVEAAGPVDSGGTVLPVFTSAAAGQVVDAQGSETETLGAEELPLVVAVLWRSDHWVIGDLSR